MCPHLGRRLPTPQHDSDTAPFCLCFSHFCHYQPTSHSSFLCLMASVLSKLLLIESSGPLWCLLPRDTASCLMSRSFHSIAPCWLGHTHCVGFLPLVHPSVAVEDLWFCLGLCSSAQGCGRDMTVPSTLNLALFRKRCYPSHEHRRVKLEFQWFPNRVNSRLSWANFYKFKFLGATHL